jgi:hypothetical protein
MNITERDGRGEAQTVIVLKTSLSIVLGMATHA